MLRTSLVPNMVAAVALLSAASWARAQCGILSWDEYRGLRRSLPYTLRLPVPSGGLLMFGAQHTHDPKHPQLPELERLWAEFRPQLAFSEGGVRPAAPGRDQAVTRYGEPGLLRFLADRDHVTLRSLEPPADEEAKALDPQFPPGQVKLYYLLRDLSDAAADGLSLDERRRSALESVRVRQRLGGPPNSLADFDTLAARLLPELTDWHSIPGTWFDPTRTDTFLNQIARRSSDYRNCHMLSLVVEAARGMRVFVVVGGSHVIVQERALRTALASR